MVCRRLLWRTSSCCNKISADLECTQTLPFLICLLSPWLLTLILYKHSQPYSDDCSCYLSSSTTVQSHRQELLVEKMHFLPQLLTGCMGELSCDNTQHKALHEDTDQSGAVY